VRVTTSLVSDSVEAFNGVVASINGHIAPRRRTLRSRLASTWAKFAPVALSASGLACITGAAFTAGLWAGLVAAGVSFFVLEWRIHG